MNLLHFILLAIGFLSCQLSSGVKKDTQNRILSHKEFIKSLDFNGIVSKKILCEECKYNRYQVIIDLDEVSPKSIKLSDRSFPPYYFFLSDKQLNMSLIKSAFDLVKENLAVKKRANSDSLLLTGAAFRILSEKKYEWLPH